MSHFTLRMGDLLHFHPFAHRHTGFLSVPERRSRAGNMPEAALSTSEDPAFFGLCKETQPEDRRVEMDRFSMLTCDDEDSGGLDETVLYLL